MQNDGRSVPVLDPDGIARLRRLLGDAGFTVDGLAELWGEVAGDALHRGLRMPAARATEDDGSARARLARLFVLGLPAASEGLELLVELALARPDAEDARLLHPLVDLRPYAFADDVGVGEWWVASDLSEVALGGAIPEDHVLGIGGASLTLAGITVRRPVRSVLDLGTGCGIQALHARRHADRVVATDLSARALAFAAFTAELNGMDGIEFRLGSLYEPVAGERFDLIVTNPPFVITPRVAGVPSYEYRDGGLVGDGLLERVLVDGIAHLEPGGVLQSLGNWEDREGGASGLERVRGWLGVAGEGSAAAVAPVDVWLLERETQDPAAYAETWIRDGGTRPGSPEFDRLYGAWLDDFAARDVRSVGFGYVALRRTADAATSRVRTEHYDAPTAGGLGAAVGRTLDGIAALRRGPLGDRLARVASDVTEERHYWPGDEHPAAITLRQGGGFARSLPAGTALAAVVGACDGELPLRAIADAVAQLLEADPAALWAELEPELEELVVVGMLELD